MVGNGWPLVVTDTQILFQDVDGICSTPLFFMVGKEWWVSANWGLGVAGIVHIASMKLPNTDSRATADALSLVLSATYN